MGDMGTRAAWAAADPEAFKADALLEFNSVAVPQMRGFLHSPDGRGVFVVLISVMRAAVRSVMEDLGFRMGTHLTLE